MIKHINFLINIKSVTDITKYLRWCCTARFIITIDKIWISGKEYGVSLRCLQIEVISQNARFFPVKKYIETNYMFGPIPKVTTINKSIIKKVLKSIKFQLFNRQ